LLLRTAYKRNPNVGVFAAANDRIAVVPRACPGVFEEDTKKTFGVEVVRTNISGTSLVGVFVAMNNKGILLPKNAYGEEIKAFEDRGINVGVCQDKYTALGNLILVNSYGAAVSKGFGKRGLKLMEDTFECEVEVVDLRDYKTLGSIGLVTDKGGVIHPMVTDEEVEELKGILGVDIDAGTVNRGVGFLRTGAIANSRGVMVGGDTTGPEITRIQDALGLL
jgi:translation initiation factor 6